MKTMKNLINILWQNISLKRKWQTFVLILFSFVTSIFEVFTVGSLFNLFSYLTNLKEKSYLELTNTSFNFLSFFKTDFQSNDVFALFIIFLIIACICRIILLWSMLRFSHTIGNDMGILMFRKILEQPMEFHYSATTSEIISNLTKKIHILSLEIVHPIILVSSNIIIISVVLGYLLFNTGIEVSIVFLSLISIFYLFWKLSKSRIIKNSKIISNNSDLLVKVISETMSAIKLISMKKKYSIFTYKFGLVNRKLKFAEGENVFLSQSIRIWLELVIIVFGTIFCLVSVNSGTFLNILPLLGGLVFGVYRLMPLILKAYSGFATIMGAKESFNDVLSYMTLKNSKFENQDNFETFKFKQKIVFNDVSYHYPSANIPSINNINCTINKYQITGILGKTGSGKTTLVSLVAALIKPSIGEILIDQTQLNTNSEYVWQNKISFVPQETIIIDGSIKENITLMLDEEVDIKKLKDTLKITNLEKFIPHLFSKKLIGERGVKISGGERQRIGLARAIYDDKEILILDEPFSALDKKTAESILLNIKNYKNYTVLIVTHDKFVIPFCDKVIELHDGNIKKKFKNKM